MPPKGCGNGKNMIRCVIVRCQPIAGKRGQPARRVIRRPGWSANQVRFGDLPRSHWLALTLTIKASLMIFLIFPRFWQTLTPGLADVKCVLVRRHCRARSRGATRFDRWAVRIARMGPRSFHQLAVSDRANPTYFDVLPRDRTDHVRV